MPVYEFQCGGCDDRFEVLQRVDDASPRCPSCGAADVRRVLSGFARPRPAGGRDPAWTPAATRSDAVGGGHSHHH